MFITVVLIMIVVIIRWPSLSGHHIFEQLKFYVAKKTILHNAVSSSPSQYSDDLLCLRLIDHVSEGVQGYAQLTQKVKLISELQSCQYCSKEITVPAVMHLKGHYQSLVNRDALIFMSHIVSSINQILLSWQEGDLL